jgi:L-lactate dehydrogenase (cytochrome)
VTNTLKKRPRNIFSSEDARIRARRRLPRMIFDFIDGATGLETTPERNRQGFADIQFQPRVLRNVSKRSTAKDILGQSFDVPFGICPMGMCNAVHPDADRFLAEAALERNMPVVLSAAGSTSLEDMARFAGKNAWFQLYASPNMNETRDMVLRAKDAGYENLILTVDVPQVSRRVRDLKNGFQMPFKMGIKQFTDCALHPRWALHTAYRGAPRPVNFETGDGKKFDRTASRAGADWGFLQELRKLWTGKLIVKGVTAPLDALRISEIGADGVWVSNHGGRQLDSAPAAIKALAKIRKAVGPDFPLIFDSGVRDAEDIIKALTVGADFVMMGRPMLFAIGAGGQNGLSDLLSEISEAISTTMAQIGICDLNELGPNILDCHPDHSGDVLKEKRK